MPAFKGYPVKPTVARKYLTMGYQLTFWELALLLIIWVLRLFFP